MFVPALDPPDPPPEGGLWFCVRSGEVRVDEGEAPLDRAAAGVHFLGLLDGTPCWALDVPDRSAAQGYQPLRRLFGRLPEPLWTVAGRAVQIVEWDRTHRFCGRCGTPTEPAPGERARRCPACGLLAFPRLAPAIIVLVARGDAMLLAHGRAFPTPMYSTLAGFVEPGETLEEAVHREVAEEVGVSVRDVRYVASQPWPFPHSLMIGFTARWAGGDIRIDEREIVDAGWFSPPALPPLPPRPSIARRLIDDFLAGDRAPEQPRER